jgi:hydrogenase 3 maturation protease
MLVVQGLKPFLADNPNWTVIAGGPAPENFSGTLRKENPGLVILADAANMGDLPGTIRFFETKLLDGFSGSTHTLPLSVLAKYLETELDCRVVLLGVQAESLEFGGKVSQPVQQAAQEIIDFLVEVSCI